MSNKKSILFVNGHLNVGGVEKALVDLLRWIDYDSYDVDLLLLEGDGDYRDQLPGQVRVLHKDIRHLEGPFARVLLNNLKRGRIGGVFYRSIQTFSRLFGHRFLGLLRFLMPVRSHYDIAIAFRPGHYAEIVAYVVPSGKKYCWWHHGAVPESCQEKQALAELLGEFDRVIAVSQGCRDLIRDELGLPENRIAIIPNIIDSVRIKEMAGDDDPYGSDDRFRIVSLCRLSPEKHLEDAVAAASLIESKLDFVWYIIGDGPDYSCLADKVKALHLENRIVFTGNLNNPYPYLKYADLLVHPSQVESLCISVLEAMALETPCLVVHSIGPDSYMQDGKNGFLVGKGPESIAEGIISVMSKDRTCLESIRGRGFELVSGEFSPESVMSRFCRLLDE